jgi:hypothetical protein
LFPAAAWRAAHSASVDPSRVPRPLAEESREELRQAGRRPRVRMAFRLNAARREGRSRSGARFVSPHSWGRQGSLGSSQPRRRARRGALSGGGRRSLVVQPFSQADEFRPELLAAQLYQEPDESICSQAVGQSLQTVLILPANLVGSRRGGFLPNRRRVRMGSLARSLRPAIRSLRSRRRGWPRGWNELVELRPRQLRMGAVRMGGEKRAPSIGRFRPLGDSIIQVLVEICCGDRVDRRIACLGRCGREGSHDKDPDAISPSSLRQVFELWRRIHIDGCKRQRQRDYVFPRIKHALPR